MRYEIAKYSILKTGNFVTSYFYVLQQTFANDNFQVSAIFHLCL
jgi:hypothetical protein